MAFRTPIDYGFAQVIDNSGLVNAYAQQQIAANKAKALREKEMADQLAKIKPDGIKEADIPYIETQYKNLQGLYHKAANSNSLKDKAELDSAIRQMSYDIEKSKNSQKLYVDNEKFYTENSKKNILDKDYLTRNQAVKGISTFSPDYETVTNDIDRLKTAIPRVDLGVEYEKLLANSTTKNGDEVPIGGGRFEKTVITGVNPNVLRNKLAERWKVDDNFKENLMEPYYDAYFQTDKAMDSKEAKGLGFVNYNPNSLTDYISLQVMRTAKPKETERSTKGSGNTTVVVNNNNGDARVAAGTAVQYQPVAFTNATDVKDGKKVTDVKENTVSRNHLAVNGEADVSTYGGINMDTGEKYTDKDVISGKVISMGQFPILKKTGGFVKDRHVKQLETSKAMDWKDFFVVAVQNAGGVGSTRVAVPMSQYPLKDVWSKAYEEIGLKGQVQGANIDASKQNTNRLDKIQTELKSKKTPKTETPKTVKYMVGKEEYEIPSNLVSKFIAKYPKAKKK